MKRKKKYFNSSTIPLLYWWNIQDTNNFIWLVKDANHSIEDVSKESIEVFNQINNFILNKYGVGNDYLRLLNKRKKYLVLMNKGLSEGDRHTIWKAGLVKKEIDKINSVESDVKREDSLIIIGKFVYGKPISAMDLTLDQYYANMDFANKTINAQNRLNKSNNG